MANHRSALKRIRQSEKRTTLNKGRVSRIKTFIKKFVSSLNGEGAGVAFSQAQSQIQKGVTKGALHKNTANRGISRLSKLLRAATTK